MQQKSESVWIKQPKAIFTANDQDATGGVVIADGKIAELVPGGQQPSIAVDTVYDACEQVVTPGLVNTHHHLYQTLTRAFPSALNKALFPWLKTLYPVWAGLTPEMLHSATRLGLAELMLSGCTTVADHHYLFPDALHEAVDIQVEAARSMGCRVTLTRGGMSLGEEQGGLPPQSVVQTDETILFDCERVVHAYHDPTEASLIQIALAPCSPFSVTRELMQETAALARKLNVRLHTHLAETADETEFCQNSFGCRPLDYLEQVNWLSDDVWLAHGIHFTLDELRRMGEVGMGICHCPSSNMVLSSGICHTKEAEKVGVVIGLGVDGSASNDASNMIQEVRQALLINRLRYPAHEVTHLDALYWATKGSAKLLGREELGELAVGKQADIALFRLNELRFSGAHDALAALVLCGASRVDGLIIQGQWKVQNGLLLEQDIEAIQREHQQQASALIRSV